ncbi:glycosyl transferase [Bacteroidia bacterium]|nr:glycosyl transferase [Bacteroidia bacterium]
MDVSIIIVNYNTKQLTANCIDSVFEKTEGINFEIILVDNASTDGSKEHFRNDARIQFIESDENLGFGRANNLGAKYAKGKYLFLLNSDTILLNNAVKILANFLDDNPKVGICGGNLFDENQQPTLSYAIINSLSIKGELNLLSNNNMMKIKYGKNVVFNYSNRPIAVYAIIGADLMIRSNIFRQINGFDEDFFMYHEELELAHRVKKLGYKIYCTPDAKIIHLGGKSLPNVTSGIKWWMEGRNLLYKKVHTPLYHRFCNSIHYFFLLSRIIKFNIFKQTEKKIQYKLMIKELLNKE